MIKGVIQFYDKQKRQINNFTFKKYILPDGLMRLQENKKPTFMRRMTMKRS